MAPKKKSVAAGAPSISKLPTQTCLVDGDGSDRSPSHSGDKSRHTGESQDPRVATSKGGAAAHRAAAAMSKDNATGSKTGEVAGPTLRPS